MSDVPFRWNLARREQLGRLAGPPTAPLDDWTMDHLRECCAKVIAASNDGRMVFVGRSPESLYDYLCGALAETSWVDRLTLLNVSMRNATVEQIEPHALDAIHRQFVALGLSPAEIAASERPVAFIDLLMHGWTYGNLFGMLDHWARHEGVDVAAVKRRMRVIGITERTKNSPNTWRWYQRAPWVKGFARSALRSISIPYGVWTYLGDSQEKVARWNPPFVWGTEYPLAASHEPARLEALRLALAIHERGRRREERERLASALAARPEMRNAWLRGLVLELRRG